MTVDRNKGIREIFYNHLNLEASSGQALPKKIVFDTGEITYLYDATGVKLKKSVMDENTSQTTSTHYLGGFQYTEDHLDFFPHAEGYAKAIPTLGGGSSYQFKYVFTYTDHLGNIRLKYAQDPSNNNQISILEEDHYYPYGLKHSGYNSFHQIFTTEDGDGPGTGIVLTPVNPFLGDSHKYKFGGKEYQDEFDVNTYDFGARNYDPALVRTFTQDPLGEAFYELSPYSFLNNNPMSNIDPTGALTLTGQAARDWFQGLKDDIASRPKKRKEEFEFEDDDEREDWIKHKGSSKAVLADGSRRDAVDSAATVGGCPDGDCGDKKINGANKANTVVGTVAEGVRRNASYHSENYNAKYGTKTTSAKDITKATRSSMTSTSKYARGVGTGTSIIAGTLGILNFAMSDQSWGDYGQLGVSLLSAGLTVGSVTAPIGIGIGFVDMGGGFNGFYEYLDNQQQLYDTSGGVMAPMGLMGLPVFVPLK